MKRREVITLLGGAPELGGEVCSVGHQTSRFDVVPIPVHRGQSRPQC